MLSRAADSIYWMSRYLERADNISRFIDVNMHLMLDLGIPRTNDHWHALVRTSGDEKDFDTRYSQATETNVIKFLVFDLANGNSLISCIHKARENARTVREIISSDMWELLNELYHYVNGMSRKHRVGDLEKFLIQIRKFNHLFVGVSENCFSHGEGWHFVRLGQLIERADKTARILDVKYFLLLPSPEYVDSPLDTVEWGAVLKSATAFEMYRKRFHRANYHDVTDFLIFDHEFPRSVAFCLRQMLQSLIEIADLHGGQESGALKEVRTLHAWLKERDIDTLWKTGLHEFIDDLEAHINQLHQTIHECFFAIRP